MELKQQFKETTEGLELTYHWYQPYHRLGCTFLLIWVVLSSIIYHFELISLVRGDLAFPQNAYAVAFFFMLIVVPAYWALLYKFNRTTVLLNASELKVWNGPLPCWRRNGSIAMEEIRFLRIQERRSDSKKYGSRDLIALMKNGEVKNILMDMKDPDESVILLKLISKLTRIPSYQSL